MGPGRWHVVLPVKGGPAAKSRLGASRPGALAVAIARDTLDAARAARSVRRLVVVTVDETVARVARAAGDTVVPESRPGAGLVAAVGDGVRAAGAGPVAVLLADLPALRAAELDAALDQCRAALHDGAGWVVVPDAEGSGTVLIAALDGGRLVPSFGPGSAAAHERAGALRLEPQLPGLRRDVDTSEALREALALGVGTRTRAALARHRPRTDPAA